MVEEFVQEMDDVALEVLDKYAPLLTRIKLPDKVANRWLSLIVVDAKRKERLLEKLWKKSKLEAADSMYILSAC